MSETETKLKKRWLQMGVELEGSWIRNRTEVAGRVRGAAPKDDASVHIGHGHPGEIITRPHDNLDKLCEDISILWPDTVNDSCGFHIHTSFTPIDTGMIATREFYDFFKAQWERWGKTMGLARNHEFWNRLAGKNKFAMDKFDPSGQLKPFGGKRETRYTLINFHSWEKHKTVEVRLLPMFTDKEVALSAVRHLAWVYDSFLNSHTFQTITVESNVEVRGDMVEETYECVTPLTTPQEISYQGKLPPLETGPDVYYSIRGSNDLMLPHGPEEVDQLTP
jgi:hypothetical protein